MVLQKSKEIAKKLPAFKPHLDFIAAVLTIPVLITVIILNFANLAKPKAPPSLTPTPNQNITAVPVAHKATTPTPTDSPSCNPGIGKLSITTPQENDTVTANPVCVTIEYDGTGYCSVVWAYSINSGPLSDYSNNSVCLYNMPEGPIHFQLQVKSLTSGQTQTIVRNFTYTPPTPTPSPTQIPVPTASVSPTPTTHP